MRRSGVLLVIGPWLASGLIRTLRHLMRWRYVNEEAVLRQNRDQKPYLHAFFHDQLLMMTYSYLGARWGRRLSVLASRHRDGEYVARTLERFGHIMVRGSSGRGGVGGLRQMVRHLKDGRDAAFATDGPRGPRHQVQIGVIEAARLAGAPIVPVAFAASKKKLCAPGTNSRSRCRSRAAFSSTAIHGSCRPAPAET